MDGLRAIPLVAHDLWEEFALLALVGVVGGLLSLLLLPLPFVIAAHYATAARIAEQRVGSLSTWFSEGWSHARFFYQWFLLLLLVGLVLGSGVWFYGRLATAWALPLRWFAILCLVIWLLPQPFVPALYWQQVDRRLSTALRNAFVLTAHDPLSPLLLWLIVILLSFLLSYFAWPLLLLTSILAAVFTTRTLQLKLPSPS
jgi:hypothetical protein